MPLATGSLRAAAISACGTWEFGVESANDAILRYLRKPFRVRHLYEACHTARDLGLYVIPNLIMGIPGDDYEGTLA